MNKRRRLILAFGAGALAAPLASFAQQPARVWRVGFLIPRSRPTSVDADYFSAFFKGMRELGYVEGKNLLTEWRTADGNYERLPGLAAELVQLEVDVIVAATSLAVSAARKATTAIPIVMVSAPDPVGSGFVASLARPGGNITGLSNIAIEVSSKHLEILLAMVPKLSRVVILVNPASSSNAETLKNIRAAAQRVGVMVLTLEARNLREIESAFTRMNKENAGALIVARDPLLQQHARQIAELAAKHRMPSAFGTREPVEAGGLMSYGSSNADAFQRAATYVDKIFKGTKPADLPVEQPMKFELIINGKTAKALGLTISQELRLRADKVIE